MNVTCKKVSCICWYAIMLYVCNIVHAAMTVYSSPVEHPKKQTPLLLVEMRQHLPRTCKSSSFCPGWPVFRSEKSHNHQPPLNLKQLWKWSLKCDTWEIMLTTCSMVLPLILHHTILKCWTGQNLAQMIQQNSFPGWFLTDVINGLKIKWNAKQNLRHLLS